MNAPGAFLCSREVIPAMEAGGATRAQMPDKPNASFDPAGVADIAWTLTQRSRRA